MDIFKLIYQHDIRLDQLRERHTDRNKQDITTSIEDFMRPDPTYSKFYFTGTSPDQNLFGLNMLSSFDAILKAFEESLEKYTVHAESGEKSLSKAVTSSDIGRPIFLTPGEDCPWLFEDFKIEKDSNVGHNKEAIASLLETDDLLLYKEQAHDGFDLHLFSKENLYRDLFYPLQKLVEPSFRFFSMNGKRITSERKFYFETWTLQKPPHGVEEVFQKTVL